MYRHGSSNYECVGAPGKEEELSDMKSRMIGLMALFVMGVYIGLSGCDMPGKDTCKAMTGYRMSELTDNIAVPDNNLYDSVLRFHVLANSDYKEDQRVKLKVKDVVVRSIAKDMKEAGVATKNQACEYVTGNMNRYIEMAEHVLEEEGYSYGVRGELTRCWFPVKIYGDKVYPEGEYDAFRLLIGRAEGKNWWCVLFPSLCMVDEAYMVPEEKGQDGDKNSVSAGGEVTEQNVTSEQEKEENDVKIRLRIVEWLQNMW